MVLAQPAGCRLCWIFPASQMLGSRNHKAAERVRKAQAHVATVIRKHMLMHCNWLCNVASIGTDCISKSCLASSRNCE
jgi:hypothetical protein